MDAQQRARDQELWWTVVDEVARLTDRFPRPDHDDRDMFMANDGTVYHWVNGGTTLCGLAYGVVRLTMSGRKNFPSCLACLGLLPVVEEIRPTTNNLSDSDSNHGDPDDAVGVGDDECGVCKDCGRAMDYSPYIPWCPSCENEDPHDW